MDVSDNSIRTTNGQATFDDSDDYACINRLPCTSNRNKIAVLGTKKLKTEKQSRIVLPEEKYVETLQKIIQRDYFPELSMLKAQKEYLDALAENDLSKIRELQLLYSTKRMDKRISSTSLDSPERHDSPELFDPETPSSNYLYRNAPWNSTRSDVCNKMGDNEKKSPEPSEQLTVNQFVNKFTNEDNASFEEIALLDSKRERNKNAWMYEAEEKHNKEQFARANEQIKAADEQLMLMNTPEKVGQKPKDLDNWICKARNNVLFNLDEVPLTPEERLRRQKMNEKIINKAATRFHYDLHKVQGQKSIMRQNIVDKAGKVDITGCEIKPTTNSDLDLLATPSLAPGVEDTPLMTWGEIEGTPFRLDAADLAISGVGSAPAFKIPDLPLREKIAQDMTESIAKGYLEKRKSAIRQAEKYHTKTPSFSSVRNTDRLLVMSPAARRLATKGLGIRLGSDKQLKASYTPVFRRSRTPASSRMLSTPGAEADQTLTAQSTPNSDSNSLKRSITDNLLNFGEEIEKKSRPTAADFF